MCSKGYDSLDGESVTEHPAFTRAKALSEPLRSHFPKSAKAVPGNRHEDEIHDVLDHGAKLAEALARELFPVFRDVPYAD